MDAEPAETWGFDWLYKGWGLQSLGILWDMMSYKPTIEWSYLFNENIIAKNMICVLVRKSGMGPNKMPSKNRILMFEPLGVTHFWTSTSFFNLGFKDSSLKMLLSAVTKDFQIVPSIDSESGIRRKCCQSLDVIELKKVWHCWHTQLHRIIWPCCDESFWVEWCLPSWDEFWAIDMII